MTLRKPHTKATLHPRHVVLLGRSCETRRVWFSQGWQREIYGHWHCIHFSQIPNQGGVSGEKCNRIYPRGWKRVCHQTEHQRSCQVWETEYVFHHFYFGFLIIHRISLDMFWFCDCLFISIRKQVHLDCFVKSPPVRFFPPVCLIINKT